MELEKDLREKRQDILRLALKHGVKAISVFGSVARGEAGPDSDVDFLVEVEGPTPPWFPGGLVADLEELLGRPVDVVEPDALREPLRQRVLKEALPL